MAAQSACRLKKERCISRARNYKRKRKKMIAFEAVKHVKAGNGLFLMQARRHGTWQSA
ncbi:hypothetical protein PO124_21180 [Bacillus licheniformis]|nr:hypothetical protein [Bacillus licheniformis]